MKHISLIVQCFLLLTFSAQTWAISDSQSCEEKSKQMRGAARESFLSSCLAQTLKQSGSPERVKAVTAQEKRNTCEQNAKNMKLDGGKKSEYVNDCLNKNVAANEAKKSGAKEPALAKAEHAPRAKAVASGKPAVTPKHAAKPAAAKHTASKKSCAKQAKLDGLKGEARKKFMNDCRKV